MKRFCYFNLPKLLSWSLSLALILIVASCSDKSKEDEPTPPTDEQEYPAVVNPEEEETPIEEEEPAVEVEPQIPEGNVSNYHIPEESEFLGCWRVVWAKCEEWRCFYGQWSLWETRIMEESDLAGVDGWPYFIGFLYDAWDQYRMVWGSSAVCHFDEILTLVEEEGDGSFGGVYIHGGLFNGDAYRWIWYPNAGNDISMIVLKDGKNVAHRWEITMFDGDSFTVSPPFNDFPQTQDGATTFRWTRKYKKITNN